jgi:adenylosuccinate synthase
VTEYEQLPEAAKVYIARIEELMGGVQCKYIGVGPGRAAMV